MNLKKTGVAIFIFLVLFSIGGHFYNRWYHDDVKSHPVMYAYDTISGALNSAILMPSQPYESAYIAFFEDPNRTVSSSVPFPIETIDKGQKVYVLKKDTARSLVKIAVYQQPRKYIRKSFITGWVHLSLLHDELPETFQEEMSQKILPK